MAQFEGKTNQTKGSSKAFLFAVHVALFCNISRTIAFCHSLACSSRRCDAINHAHLLLFDCSQRQNCMWQNAHEAACMQRRPAVAKIGQSHCLDNSIPHTYTSDVYAGCLYESNIRSPYVYMSNRKLGLWFSAPCKFTFTVKLFSVIILMKRFDFAAIELVSLYIDIVMLYPCTPFNNILNVDCYINCNCNVWM